MLAAASARIRFLYPDYWDAHQGKHSNEETEALVAAGPPVGSDEAFGSFRRVMAAALELEVAVLHLKTSGRMLRLEPETALLQSLGITEGTWVQDAYNGHFQALATALERSKALVIKTVREFHRRYDPVNWKRLADELVAELEGLRVKVKPQRDSATHVGSLEPVARSGFWEGLASIAMWPDAQSIMVFMPAHRPNFANSADLGTVVALGAIGRAVAGLDAIIDWGRLAADD